MTRNIRDPKSCHAGSWIIRAKDDGRVICEVFSRRMVASLNTDKYEAVPILEYLGSLNGREQ